MRRNFFNCYHVGIFLVTVQPSCEHEEKGKKTNHPALWYHGAAKPPRYHALPRLLKKKKPELSKLLLGILLITAKAMSNYTP